MVEVLNGSALGVSLEARANSAKPSHPYYFDRSINSLMDRFLGTGVYYPEGSETYSKILDRLTEIIYKRKIDNPVSENEILERLIEFHRKYQDLPLEIERLKGAERERRTEEYKAERDARFKKLNYDLGIGITPESVRGVLNDKLKAYMWKKLLLLRDYFKSDVK